MDSIASTAFTTSGGDNNNKCFDVPIQHEKMSTKNSNDSSPMNISHEEKTTSDSVDEIADGERSKENLMIDSDGKKLIYFEEI